MRGEIGNVSPGVPGFETQESLGKIPNFNQDFVDINFNNSQITCMFVLFLL